jgi:hypothetical protein
MAKALPVLGIDPEASVLQNAPVITGVRIAELIAWERYISDPDNVSQLHEMRIAAKRLRYTLELFAPHYGETAEKAVARIKELQDYLGRIHDIDVLTPVILEELQLETDRALRRSAKLGAYAGDPDGCMGLVRLWKERREERERLYRRFLVAWVTLRDERYFEKLKDEMRRRAAEELTAREKENGKAERARQRGRSGRSGDDTGIGDHPRESPAESGFQKYSKPQKSRSRTADAGSGPYGD